MSEGSSEIKTWDIYGQGCRPAKSDGLAPEWVDIAALAPQVKAQLAERAQHLVTWGLLDGLTADEKRDLLLRLVKGLLDTATTDQAAQEWPPAPKLKVPDSGQVVYYLRFGARVKIGTSRDFTNRLRNLPHDEVLAIEHGGRGLERERHEQFAHLRVNREWFYAGSDLLAFAQALPPFAA